MHWMEENHPENVEEMRFYPRFLTVARSVDTRAWEYRNRLDSQYLSGDSHTHGFEKLRTVICGENRKSVSRSD